MTRADPHTIELELVVEAIFRRYGYDFRHYARASLERRVRDFARRAGMHGLLPLLPRILHDEQFASSLVDELAVPVTELFRDPDFYREFRTDVIPILKTYPYVKIWHAGCATGEEVYSMAVILHEEGFLDRAQLYATDFNQRVLDQARRGIYRIDDVRKATHNYNQTAPKGSFHDYYHARYQSAVIERFLRSRITFAHHNLATEAAFGSMHVIVCRNVLIYFDKELQTQVLSLFRDSLTRRGFLVLGSRETLDFSPVASDFEATHERWRIYRLR